MNTCRKCNLPIPGTKIINGKVRWLHKRKYCLKCTPFGQHGALAARLRLKPKTTRICTRCKIHKNIKFFYIKPREHSRFIDYHSICKKCYSWRVVQKSKSKKQQIVNLLGGKCMDCGYNKSISALEFHHRNPQSKDVKIAKIQFYGWKRIIKELKKCDLVCANCHRERHDKLVV